MLLTQHQAHSAMGQAALLHGQTLFFIPTTDLDNITLPLYTHNISSHFCGHALLAERMKLSIIIHFKGSTSFWQPVAGEERFSFILTLGCLPRSLTFWSGSPILLSPGSLLLHCSEWVHLLGWRALLVLFEESMLEDSVLELLRKEERKPCNSNYTKPKHIWESNQINCSNG